MRRIKRVCIFFMYFTFPTVCYRFLFSFLFNLENSYAKKSIARLTEQIEETFYFWITCSFSYPPNPLVQVRPIHPCCEAANNGIQNRPDEGKIVKYVRQRFVSSFPGHFHISRGPKTGDISSKILAFNLKRFPVRHPYSPIPRSLF